MASSKSAQSQEASNPPAAAATQGGKTDAKVDAKAGALADQAQAQQESSNSVDFLPLFAPPGIRFCLHADFKDDFTMRVALTIMMYQSFGDEVRLFLSVLFSFIH